VRFHWLLGDERLRPAHAGQPHHGGDHLTNPPRYGLHAALAWAQPFIMCETFAKLSPCKGQRVVKQRRPTGAKPAEASVTCEILVSMNLEELLDAARLLPDSSQRFPDGGHGADGRGIPEP
jgi:hypothetical protein